jgi:shikimate dehydrogenase
MHNAGYAALGLHFVYVPFAVEDLNGALQGMRALGIRGFGVSMPFKIDVLPLLDRIDPLAERIGAVNTIVNDDGVLTGYNTDAWGAARALEEALPIAGKRIVVIGAGGAARAVAHSLVSEGARVHLVNRSMDKAMALAAQVSRTGLPAARGANPSERAPASGAVPRATSGGLEELEDLRAFDALVNCSSAGMDGYGSASPVPERELRPELVVMDIVYKPIETELVAAAQRAGSPVLHGGRMLLHQAARQFELYTGKAPPLAAMGRALDGAIQRG